MLLQILIGVLACIVAVQAVAYPDLYSRAQANQNADDELMGIYRLPNDTVPEHYSVRLVTNVHREDFTFSGEVDININVVQTTSVITLHHRQLVIGSVRLNNANTPTVDVLLAPIAYDEATNLLSVPLASTVAPLAVGSKYILHITFTGTLRTDQGGFYRSSYTANDGTNRWLATTQFAATDARHGFPCYDEPALRATFDISITHGANYSAVSNMDIVGPPTTLPNGMVTTTFQRMVSTPTYLVAYVVSDYTYISQTSSALPRQRVYARPNAIAAGSGTYALNAGIAVLEKLSTYFGIPYGLSKLDQVAIPDFWFGAMENWGIIMYREETLLLFSNATFINERRVATVISHEYTHQWFGNLVTPKWWTWIWLNEGFATLFENYATDWINPDWKILDAFVLTLQNVMQADATPNIRAMSHYVENPVAIQNIFDTIAYPKSGSVLRMFLHAFTENSFKKGLSNYLRANEYKAADEEDLFQQIEIAVKQDGTLPTQLTASAIMGSWTRQSGFPLVTVTRNYADGSFELSQERYFTVKPATQHSSLWWIPYNFATSSSSDFSNTAATGWMPATSRTLRVGDASVPSGSWLVLNKQQSGYYRIQYDTQNYQLIANELSKGDFQKIHLVSRAQIIDDVFDFARTERLNYTTVFDIIKYLQRDTDYVPWAAAFNGLTFVNRMYSGSSKYEEFTEFVVMLLKNLYAATGVLDVENEPHYHKQSRISAMNWACKFGLEECLTSTNNLLKEYLSTNTAIHQNNFEAVLCNGVRTATQQEYENLWAKLQAEENTIVRQRIITAMACASDKEKLLAFIETSVGSMESEVGYLSAAERYRVFTEVAANGQNGASVAIQFLRDNIDSANTMYGSSNVNAAIVQLARYSVTDNLQQEFKKLLEELIPKTYVSAVTFSNADAAVTENQRWVERNQHDIETWISEYDSGASTIAVSSLVIALLMVITRLF